MDWFASKQKEAKERKEAHAAHSTMVQELDDTYTGMQKMGSEIDEIFASWYQTSQRSQDHVEMKKLQEKIEKAVAVYNEKYESLKDDDGKRSENLKKCHEGVPCPEGKCDVLELERMIMEDYNRVEGDIKHWRENRWI